MSDIGKNIWSRNHEECGTITAESYRICAVCGYHPCYIVKWNDGTKTKPCTKGVSILENGDLEIN